MERHNHCITANSLTVCSDPSDHCLFYKPGYEDCFYFCQQKCCNVRAILAFAEATVVKKVEKQEEGGGTT